MKPFVFKQFEINHTKSAMKIGTDGVLLGAMATHSSPTRILDIGSGSGLVGLMLAQRFPKASADLVEIEEQAATESRDNVTASPFAQRCRVFHQDILKYEAEEAYDLIVSNPPYHLGNHQSFSRERSLARQTDLEYLSDILVKAKKLLNTNGVLTMILPTDVYDKLDFVANKNGLWCFRKTLIHSFQNEPPVRILAEWNHEFVPTEFKRMIIYNNDRSYTNAYKELTSDFYLYF